MHDRDLLLRRLLRGVINPQRFQCDLIFRGAFILLQLVLELLDHAVVHLTSLAQPQPSHLQTDLFVVQSQVPSS